MSWRLPVLAALLLCAAPAVARPDQEGRPGVSLRLDPCLEVDRAQVERLFTIELGAQLAAAPDEATSDLSVTCGAAGAELRVDDPVTGKSLQRSIDLSAATTRARPRLLALALAELLFTSWSELEVYPVPDPAAAAADAGAVQQRGGARGRVAGGLVLPQRLPAVVHLAVRPGDRPRRLPPGRLRLLGLFGGQGWRGTGLLLGGGLRLGGDYAHHLGFSTDVLAHHGQSSFPLGAVSIDTISTSAALVFHAQRSFLSLRAGAGARLGAVRLAGAAQDPSQDRAGSLWGPFCGPLAVALASAALPAHVALELSLEGGYVVLPVAGRVDGQRAVAVDGGWLAAQLGVGWRR